MRGFKTENLTLGYPPGRGGAWIQMTGALNLQFHENIRSDEHIVCFTFSKYQHLVFACIFMKQNLYFQKLKSRKDALKKIDWSEKKKEKVRTVLTTNYMSSESSCSEESDRETLTIRPLQWESRKLRKYKKKLDKCSKEAMSLKSVRLRRKRNRNKEKPSLRLVPRDIPGWAHREAAATEEKITTAETENNENTTLDRDPFDFGSESDFDYPL